MNQPQNIDKAIQYQDGSVVSREVLNQPTGTITLFAFAKDQGLSEHVTPYEAVAIITDGTAEITLSGEKHIVNAGEMLQMPANMPHALKAVKPFKMLLVMVKSLQL